MSLKGNNTDYEVKPYYIQETKIENVTVDYNVEKFGNNFDIELTLVLTEVQNGDNKFQPTIVMRGNLKKDHNGLVIGWGNAIPLKSLYGQLNYKEDVINDDGTLSDAAFSFLIGKTIFTLRYVVDKDSETGKLKYYTWENIGKDADSLEKYFLSQVAKGYPKKYDPGLIEEKESTFDSSPAVKFAKTKATKSVAQNSLL